MDKKKVKDMEDNMNKFVEKYGQILLPLITPYDENEEVNYDTYA